MILDDPQATTRIPQLDPLSRRAMIGRLGGGLGATGVASALSADQSLSHYGGKARRVIQLFMNGGPYQGDLFDPKPALKKFEGQRPPGATLRTERITAGLLPSIRKFAPRGNSGVIVSDLLPEISSVIDDVCVLKGCHSDNPNHNPAMFLMNCGALTSAVPSVGSWVSYGLGSENRNLPSYVVLATGYPVEAPLTWTSAFLPNHHQGTHINHSNLAPEKIIPFLRNARYDRKVQRRQLDLLGQLNRKHLENRGGGDRLASRIQSMETAFRMQFEATDAFNLEQESKQTRDAYGTGKFANGCLLARRLCERGVRYVQLYYDGGQPWDTHNNHNERMVTLTRNVDRPIASLIADLKQRGLLEDTLVVWGGEFGRTPVSENGNGRDHNHHGFSMWMAGGGVRGGMTYGETDDFGFKAVTDKVHVHDVHATMLHLLGIDHTQLTYRYAGRDFRLTDVYGRVVNEILV